MIQCVDDHKFIRSQKNGHVDSVGPINWLIFLFATIIYANVATFVKTIFLSGTVSEKPLIYICI